MVQGSLGELAGCRFIIDTGSSPTIVDRSIARRLGLRIQPASVSKLGGDSRAGAAILPSLTLGPITSNRLPVLVGDFSSAQRELGLHVDAMVGLDVLKARNFTIDYLARKLIFDQLPISTYSAPFESSPPLITIKAQVKGRPLRLLVDTGESGIVLFRRGANLGINFQEVGLRRSWQSDYVSTIRDEVELSDLRLGSLYRHKQIAYLVRGPDSVAREFDGLAGPNALGIKQITFDFDHEVLSWK